MGITSALTNTLERLPGLGKLAGAGFAAPLLKGPAEAFNEQDLLPVFGGNQTQEHFQIERALRGPSPMQEMARQQRLREVMAFNQAVLAQRFPRIYAKLLAGRELPPGASVYGGSPNFGNVEAAALGMSMGAYGPPAPPTQMQGIMGP